MFKQIVECPYCNNNVIENWKEYVYDVSSDERDMDEELEHSISCEEVECPYCKKIFSVEGSIWEYPKGALNYVDLKGIAREDYDEDDEDIDE